MTRYQKILSIVFVGFWIWTAINPSFRDSWLLESYPLLIFIPIILFIGRFVGLSSFSYTLLAMFMMLHMVGAHYTYEKVPGGFFLGELYGSTRNMYDRLVHLLFGVLVTYPAFEALRKTLKIGEYWCYFFVFNFMMTFVAGYEVLEWLTSISSNPNASMAYIGAQGDIWDTQIDMYVAFLGCVFVLVVIFLMMRRKLPSKPL
jgi:putative membrane protein